MSEHASNATPATPQSHPESIGAIARAKASIRLSQLQRLKLAADTIIAWLSAARESSSGLLHAAERDGRDSSYSSTGSRLQSGSMGDSSMISVDESSHEVATGRARRSRHSHDETDSDLVGAEAEQDDSDNDA